MEDFRHRADEMFTKVDQVRSIAGVETYVIWTAASLQLTYIGH